MMEYTQKSVRNEKRFKGLNKYVIGALEGQERDCGWESFEPDEKYQATDSNVLWTPFRTVNKSGIYKWQKTNLENVERERSWWLGWKHYIR